MAGGAPSPSAPLRAARRTLHAPLLAACWLFGRCLFALCLFALCLFALCLFALCLLAPAARAEEPPERPARPAPSPAAPAGRLLTLDRVDGAWWLGEAAEVWVKPGARLGEPEETLEEALARAEWRPAKGPREAVGASYGVMWVRVRARDEVSATRAARGLPPLLTPPAWRVEFASPRPFNLTAYIPRRGALTRVEAGLVTPLELREARSTSVVVLLDLPPAQEQTLYFRVANAPLGFSARLLSGEESAYQSQRHERLLGLYYGAAIALFLYNLFLFLSLRDVTYLWYLLLLFLMTIYFMSRNGYIWALGWTPKTGIGGSSITILLLVVIMSFTRSLLSTAEALPRYDRALVWLRRLALLVLVMTLVWPVWLRDSNILPLSALTLVSVLSAGVLSARRGSPVARLFLLAWALLITGWAVFVLMTFGLLPPNAFTEHAVQVGSALEMSLFSLALAYRIRLLQQTARERAHQLERLALTHARDLAAVREESARRVLEAHDRQNLSLARDLHDSVGHRFLLIRRTAEELGGAEEPSGEAYEEARLAIAALADEGIAESREIAHGLYPQRLLDVGLEGALIAAADLITRCGLPVTLELAAVEGPPLSERLSPSAALTALRVAEESLQNAMRHAEARRLWLRLAPLGADRVILEVEDDGRGFSDPPQGEGLGMRTMRDRALQASGELELTRGAAGGALVRLVLRVEAEEG